jgi:hypothetical protein
MIENNNPKTQHWVPRVYLRNFATKETRGERDPAVWVLDKTSDNVFKPSIINVLVEQYLYSPLDDRGNRSFDVEKELSHIEGEINPVLDSLCYADIDLSDKGIRQKLSFFVSVLIFKNKSMIEQHKGLHKDIIYDIEYQDKATNLKPKSFISIKEVKKKTPEKWKEFRFLDDNGFQKLFARHVISGATELAPHIMKKNWGLIKSTDAAFVTCDDPAIVHHPKEETYGIGTIGIHIHLPLCPNRLLWIHDLDEADSSIYELNSTGTKSLNFFTMNFANRFVISSTDVSELYKELMK